MRTKLATFLLALILLFSMSIPALAYEVNVTGGYASCPYSFRQHYSFSTTFKDAMGNGAKAWESAGKGVLAQKSTYTNALTTYPKSDGYNNITMISTTADYLAQCSWWTSNNEIGLGHSSNSSAVMQATIGDGVKRRTISNDDILGIEDIY